MLRLEIMIFISRKVLFYFSLVLCHISVSFIFFLHFCNLQKENAIITFFGEEIMLNVGSSEKKKSVWNFCIICIPLEFVTRRA